MIKDIGIQGLKADKVRIPKPLALGWLSEVRMVIMMGLKPGKSMIEIAESRIMDVYNKETM